MKHCRRISVLKAQTEPDPQEEQEDFMRLLVFRIGVALVAVFKGDFF